MKNSLWIVSLIFLLATGCAAYALSPGSGYSPDLGGQYGGNQQQYGQYGADWNVDMDFMYNYLAPYGNWVYLDHFGFVWTPRHMGYQWRPYRNGRWVMTEMGWTWIARERWGSIPFHYGRWGYDDYIGWFWVPGTVWGPAWVSWRWSNQYAGWAPLQPGIEIRAGMDYGSISINIPNRFWIFLQVSRFLDPDIDSYVLPYERNATLFNSTSRHDNNYFRDNRIYNEGITVDLVRQLTRRSVPQYTIRDAQQPGLAKISGKELRIYRPTIRADASAMPKEFMNVETARRELAPVKVFEPQPQSPLSVQTSAVRKRQAEEKALLERTQAQDLKNMQRQRDAELAQIRNSAEKAMIRQDNQNKMVELQNQHQAEKQQLTKRHKQDSELVKQVAQQAKQEKQPRGAKKKKDGNS